MLCPGCGVRSEESERFCRKCGANLATLPVPSGGKELVQNLSSRYGLTTVAQKDPDELTGNGVASFFVGDGFFFAAIILSATNSSVSSLLWLLLLIPAFLFFGKGFRDVWQARQIRRRLKQNELAAAPALPELEPPRNSVFDAIKSGSGELLSKPSVTERTTRELK